MFSFLYKNRIPINTKMMDYCTKSTNESIRKITEKYNEERKAIKINLDSLKVIKNNDLPNDNNDLIFPLICLLSSTTLLYYFYKASR